ncbi:MAG TPA: metal ABC transporter permease [Deltaproteobacteria bacterium]|nr:metal ABC transporter permease [Deltaproteobacteria bacterium]
MDGSTPSLDDLRLALSLFRDPILCAVVAGAVLGYLSVLVILRRMVFVTAALTQSAGLGVALAFWLGIHLGVALPPTAGALGASLIAAVALTVTGQRLHLSRETGLAAVWLFGGAGAVLVGSRITQEAHDVNAILFGSAVLVRPLDLWLVVGVGLVVLTGIVVARPALIFAGFDRDGARVQGVSVRGLELGFLVGLTAMVSVCTRALGALPVFAFAVLPGATALLAAPRLRLAFPLALVAGASSGGLGYLLAFFLDTPVGATQAALALALALGAVPLRLVRGEAVGGDG